MKALQEIQKKLKAPKNQRNNFGNYNYRSCEDILEAVKPLLAEHDAQLTISDEIEAACGRVYIKAVATIRCGEEVEVCTAYAREAETKKGMDEAQITGSASSYARKYALNGLFLIDDNKDPDTRDNRETAPTVNDVTRYPHLIKLVNDCNTLDQLKAVSAAERKKLGTDAEGVSVLVMLKDKRKKELS